MVRPCHLTAPRLAVLFGVQLIEHAIGSSVLLTGCVAYSIPNPAPAHRVKLIQGRRGARRSDWMFFDDFQRMLNIVGKDESRIEAHRVLRGI